MMDDGGCSTVVVLWSWLCAMCVCSDIDALAVRWSHHRRGHRTASRQIRRNSCLLCYSSCILSYVARARPCGPDTRNRARAHNRRQINLIFTKYSIFIIDFVFEWKRGFFFSLYRYALSHGYLFNNFNLINCMSNQLIMSVLQWSNASALLYVVSVYWLLSDAPVRLLVQRIVCLFLDYFTFFPDHKSLNSTCLLFYFCTSPTNHSSICMHACYEYGLIHQKFSSLGDNQKIGIPKYKTIRLWESMWTTKRIYISRIWRVSGPSCVWCYGFCMNTCNTFLPYSLPADLPACHVSSMSPTYAAP